MDYVTGLLSSISTELVKAIVKELRYPCCFNNFVDDLEKEKGNLIATIDSVQVRVRHAKEQTIKLAKVVDKWLHDANIEANNVEKLLNEEHTKNHCCHGHCPNWIWRYQLGKKLAKKKLVIENHIKEGRDFIQLERIATLPSGLPDFPKEKCFNFESRQITYEKLMEAMKDDEVCMIGLYGIGGCGKTTLAMEVGKVAEAEHLFDKVLFVSVSSTVEIRRIQEKIASSLQYTFPENEERERAERLFSLSSLKRLELYQCGKLLGSLFKAAIVMISLEELVIIDCNGLKHIVDGHNGMKWDGIFRRLKRIEIEECDKLEAIFPSVISCLPELESLHIEACNELKQIFEKEDENVSQRPPTFDNSFTFQRLVVIHISECDELEAIFPAYIIRCLPELKFLYIRACKELKQIFEKENENVSQRPFTFDNSFTFQRLLHIHISECDKLEAILPISCLPKLENLTIRACKELKQIFEMEDENVSQRPCFPKLNTLCVINCNKLIFVSSSQCYLPNLTSIIICGASKLQQVFEVPKLKVAILVQVPRFCQRNELQMQNVKHRFIDCSPNLTSTVNTISELKTILMREDDEDYIWQLAMVDIADEVIKALESGELPSQQNIEIEAEEGTTSDNIMIDASSTHLEKASSLDISRPKSYVAETDPKPKIIPQLQMNQQELPMSEREPFSSQVIDNNQSIQGNMTGREHEREELVSESYNDFLESDREGKRTPHLQPSKQKLSPMSSPENIKETGKEKTQEKATPKGGTIKSLAAGVEGISLGGGVTTHTESGGKDILAKDVQIFEKDDGLNVDQKIQKNVDDMIQEGSNSNLVHKESRTSVVCNDGVEIPLAFADTGARLGAYKQFVDLNDAQIALLAEAIEAYPHLWNVCNKYSERFQAWTVKTLADMLWFLRNESAVSITPQREKNFHGLCDEAVELGIDGSWVDQMRQRVVAAKDPKLDDAQTRISELKNELKNLQEFVDAQTKCFNFL
ncbi:hypothetical protein RJT34_10716 [Clitoria ternatea]|uniref:NB-ARC domain-containing protein n=1 Tax=Clitoria ternatea TaxID=43366 RepID=A0AAN9JJ59_CLITE